MWSPSQSAQPRRRRCSVTARPVVDAGPSVGGTVSCSSDERPAASGRRSDRLLDWDELEPWRRDNHYIRTGYRPNSWSYVGSAASLLYVHNESVNIWSHLLGAVGVAAVAVQGRVVFGPRYALAGTADLVVLGCFFAGAFLCLLMSAVFHALCNHSARVARWGNKLDYTGIVFLIVGSYVPALWYGFYCETGWLDFYLGAICLLGAACLVVSWFDHFRTPKWRPYRALMYVGLGLSGVGPIVQNVVRHGYSLLDEQIGLSWIILMGALYISGAFVYAVRWPESHHPFTFDIWGSSHQIFHLCVLLAVASHTQGMAKAFDYHHTVTGGRC